VGLVGKVTNFPAFFMAEIYGSIMFNPKFPAVFMVKFTAWWCNNHLET
jgi:hypothetical protein